MSSDFFRTGAKWGELDIKTSSNL